MSWDYYKPYVSVAERRREAEKAAKKMADQGRSVSPVRIEGRNIANTFWGKSWCTNLEAYSDYANRLPRGRAYVRNGSVIDLQITDGQIDAHVQGSELYKVKIAISPLAKKRWSLFVEGCAGKVTNLLDLLQGRLSKKILADIAAKDTGLFPSPREIKLDCSCPDWADMCKHVAAVLYGVGARLDTAPEHFFTLRCVEMQELITAASASATTPVPSTSDDALGGADLSEIFGIEMEPDPTPANRTAFTQSAHRKSSALKRKPASAKGQATAEPPKNAKLLRRKKLVGEQTARKGKR